MLVDVFMGFISHLTSLGGPTFSELWLGSGWFFRVVKQQWPRFDFLFFFLSTIHGPTFRAVLQGSPIWESLGGNRSIFLDPSDLCHAPKGHQRVEVLLRWETSCFRLDHLLGVRKKKLQKKIEKSWECHVYPRIHHEKRPAYLEAIEFNRANSPVYFAHHIAKYKSKHL